MPWLREAFIDELCNRQSGIVQAVNIPEPRIRTIRLCHAMIVGAGAVGKSSALTKDSIMRLVALVVLSFAFALDGCASLGFGGAPANRPPRLVETGSFVVQVAPDTVYSRLRSGISGCPSLHSLMSANRMVAAPGVTGTGGRVAVVDGSGDDAMTLWGARVDPDGRGARVTVYEAEGSSFGPIGAQMRRWASGYQQRPTARYTFDDC